MAALSGKKSRRSAFAVYQQLMQEQQSQKEADEKAKEVTVGTDGSSSHEEQQEKGSRKRKKHVAEKKKKRRKLNDEEEEENKKVKNATQPSGKWEKARKREKQASENVVTKKKRKTISTSRKQPVEEVISDSQSEDEASTGRYSLTNGDGETRDVADQEVVKYAGGSREEDGESEIGVEVPFGGQYDPESFEDSRDAACELFRLVINPVPVEQFYKEIWEKKPLLLQRHKPDYNTGWFSTKELDAILRENDLEFGRNIDITTYENGKRETHNAEGRAHASMVWEFFQDGCSVRLLNPATYSKSICLLNSTLQEHFNSCVGANVYLTPAGSQGFAPHYDDIEAFVLQLEGRKHWRVYPPRYSHETLPRSSSSNFSDDVLGEPILDTVLEPGDLLYFPRGFIHQANTLPDSHSLHVTVSTYQKNTWGDLLEKLIPAALHVATAENVEFRKGLPKECLNYMGIVNCDKDDPRRQAFCGKIAELMTQLIQYAPVDSAVDQMASDHIHNSLPPVLTEEETTIVGLGARWGDQCVEDGITLTADTRVKLIRYGAVRLVIEDKEATLYYTLQNSKVYQEKDLLGIQIHQDDAPAVDYLINAYPGFTSIDDLPIEDGTSEDKVNLCSNLYSQGLLVVDFE